MTILLGHQAVTNPATVISDAVSRGPYSHARVECYHAFNEAGANTNPAQFRLQTSVSDQGNDDWVTVVPFTVFNGTPADEVLATTVAAGATALPVAATAGFASGNLIYIRDATLANSEWAIVREIVTNTTIDTVDGVANAHAATTTTIFGSAEKFYTILDLRAVRRFRAIYLNEGGTAMNTHIKAVYDLFRVAA